MPINLNTVRELKDQLEHSGYIVLKRKIPTKKTLIHKTFSQCFNPERNAELHKSDDELLGESSAKQEYVFYSIYECDQIKQDFPESTFCLTCEQS